MYHYVIDMICKINIPRSKISPTYFGMDFLYFLCTLLLTEVRFRKLYLPMSIVLNDFYQMIWSIAEAVYESWTTILLLIHWDIKSRRSSPDR